MWRARVNAHADAKRTRRQRILCLAGGRQCLSRVGKGDEECVPLRVDFNPAVARKDLPYLAPVFGNAALYDSAPSCWSSFVEPSMSVNRKVTMPVGKSRIGQI